MPEIFQCYACVDRELAEELIELVEAELKKLNVTDISFWVDHKNIRAGDQWHPAIQQQLDDCAMGIVLVSPAFLKSKYIRRYEWHKFLGENTAHRKASCPVLLKSVENEDLPKDLSGTQIFRPGTEKAFSQCENDDERLEFARATALQIKNILDDQPEKNKSPYTEIDSRDDLFELVQSWTEPDFLFKDQKIELSLRDEENDKIVSATDIISLMEEDIPPTLLRGIAGSGVSTTLQRLVRCRLSENRPVYFLDAAQFAEINELTVNRTMTRFDLEKTAESRSAAAVLAAVEIRAKRGISKDLARELAVEIVNPESPISLFFDDCHLIEAPELLGRFVARTLDMNSKGEIFLGERFPPYRQRDLKIALDANALYLEPVNESVRDDFVKGALKKKKRSDLDEWLNQDYGEEICETVKNPAGLERACLWMKHKSAAADIFTLRNYCRLWNNFPDMVWRPDTDPDPIGNEWQANYRPAKEDIIHERPLIRKNPHFRGRKKELNLLWTRLIPGCREWIVGKGGYGKTAVVDEALRGERLCHFPDGEIVVDLYSGYSDTGIEPQKEPTPSPDREKRALRRIAHSFDQSTDEIDEKTAASEALRNKVALLVLDGAECLARENIYGILDAIPPGCGVLVVTRRTFHSNDPANIILRKIDQETGKEILKTYIRRKWADKPKQVAALETIAELVQGYPMALRMIGDLLSKSEIYKPTDLLKDLQKEGLKALDEQEILERVFQHSFSRVSEDAKMVFAIFGVMSPNPVPLDLIVSAVELEISKVRKALDKLIDYGLVNPKSTGSGNVKYVTLPHITLLEHARSCKTHIDRISSVDNVVKWITGAYPELRAVTCASLKAADRQTLRWQLSHLRLLLDNDSLTTDRILQILNFLAGAIAGEDLEDWEINRLEAEVFHAAVEVIQEKERNSDIWIRYACEAFVAMGESYFSPGRIRTRIGLVR